MDIQYTLKDKYHFETKKPEIVNLSLGWFCGIDIIDIETAKNMPKSAFKTMCAKNNIRYLTKNI